MIVDLANEHCNTPETFKAWSANLGHKDVMTTLAAYAKMSPGRQIELIRRMMRDEVDESFDVIDA